MNDVAPHTSTTDTSSSCKSQERASKRRSSQQLLMTPEDILDTAMLQDLLTEMLQHENAWAFVKPIRKSQVPDYHTKIKMPMDLSTIRHKLDMAKYKANADFMKDVLLVFENSFMYHHENTIEFHCGRNLLLFFEKRCRELGLDWKKAETTVQ